MKTNNSTNSTLLEISHLTEETTFEGKLTLTGPFILSGVFSGDILQTSDSVIQVTRFATVHGNIYSRGQIVIEGTVTGNITSENQIRILCGASINGEVKSPNTTIESGAQTNATFIPYRDVTKPIHNL